MTALQQWLASLAIALAALVAVMRDLRRGDVDRER